jgi:flagellar protein FliJ
MAKRFRFRLEPVLRLRQRREEERQRELAAAQRLVLEEEDRIRRLAEEKDREQDEVVRLYGEHADFGRILPIHRHLNIVNIRRGFSEQALAGRAQEMEARREVFLEARKKRRALDLLKERRAAEHRAEENAAETRYLNEIAVQQARRRAVSRDGL